jgi:hypothetical protein
MSTTATASQSAMENLNRRQRMTLAMDCYEDITKHPDYSNHRDYWSLKASESMCQVYLSENEELTHCIEKNWGKSGADILKEKDDHEEWRLKLARENEKLKKENEELKEELKAWESDEDVVMNGPGMFLYEETRKENEELRQFHEWNKIAALKLNDEKHLNDKLNKEIDELKKDIRDLTVSPPPPEL